MMGVEGDVYTSQCGWASGSNEPLRHQKLVRLMREKIESQNLEDSERVTALLRCACRSGGVGRSVERIWQKGFLTSV